jgi:hypothetical protein
VIAQKSFPQTLIGRLGAAVVVAALAACSEGEPPSATSATPLDLGAIVIPPESPPDRMTLSDEGGGPATLEQLPLFPDTAADLLAVSGFVNGRWSRFAGSEEDFAASKNFILTWVVHYASPSDAESAFSILLNELQSDDHYGWGIGEDAGLGHAGTCLEGDNPQLGGLHETICLWRHGPLVMIVGGGSENETPIQADAEAMDARAEALMP